MKCCLDNLSTLLYQVQRKVKLFIELKHFVYFTESDETYEDSLRSMTNSAADTRNYEPTNAGGFSAVANLYSCTFNFLTTWMSMTPLEVYRLI